MKLLTIDVGNSTVDACFFDGERIKHIGRFSHEEFKAPEERWDFVVALSVKPSFNERLRELFGERLRLLTLEDIPIEIDYESPQTLGADRVLLAYGVRELYAESAVLVSVGTALVVDLLLEGRFKGGFITAGVGLKLRALSERAEGIPPLNPQRREVFIGRNTEDCLLGGTYLESLYFIKRTAERWFKEFNKELPVYITGGDGALFEDLGFYDPLLLHRAMHRIIING